MHKKPYASFRIHFILILIVCLLGLAIPQTTRAQQLTSASNSHETHVPHELIVYFKPNCAPHTPIEQWACTEPQKKSVMTTLQSIFMKLSKTMGFASSEKSPSYSHLADLYALDSSLKVIETSRLDDASISQHSSPYLYRFDPTVSLETARLAYENRNEVLYVQYNYLYTIR